MSVVRIEDGIYAVNRPEGISTLIYNLKSLEKLSGVSTILYRKVQDKELTITDLKVMKEDLRLSTIACFEALDELGRGLSK